MRPEGVADAGGLRERCRVGAEVIALDGDGVRLRSSLSNLDGGRWGSIPQLAYVIYTSG